MRRIVPDINSSGRGTPTPTPNPGTTPTPTPGTTPTPTPGTTPTPTPGGTPGTTPTPEPRGEWTVTSWSTPTGHCGQVMSIATLSCVAEGKAVPDDRCDSPRPEYTREIEDTSACVYSWRIGNYAPTPADTCTDSYVRTKPVYCEWSGAGSDALSVSDSFCSVEGKPETPSDAPIAYYAGCSYSWVGGGFKGPGCSPKTTLTQIQTCTRDINVPDADYAVEDSFCTESKPVVQKDGNTTCSQLLNPDFETTGGWSNMSGTNGAAYSTGAAQSGSRSMRLTTSSGLSGGVSSTGFELPYTRTYNLHFYARSFTSSTVSLRVTVTRNGSQIQNLTYSSIRPSWGYYVATFVSGSGSHVVSFQTNTVGGDVMIDNIQLAPQPQ